MLADLLPRLRRTSHVPAESSAFVGRRQELSALARAVRASRLVTLTGPAGVGKTRLAQRFALGARLALESAGGVWCCDLRDTRDVEGMCGEVARALAIEGEATLTGDGAITAVGRALAARGRALLVLDNIDPLLPAGADVVLRWLDDAADLRALVTSREPLFLLGEDAIEIGPLSLPEGADGAGDGDAVALFVERVRARRGAFTPSADESKIIAERVRAARGMPAAIELGASRYAGGADTGGRGAAGSDAQVIAWGFRQLDADERQVLAQCSVFRGGFTLAAAVAVVALPRGRGARGVEEIVAELAQEGLLQAHRTSGDPRERRFFMCEAIRAQAARALELGEEAADVPFRHARYHLDRAAGPLTDLPASPISATSREELAADRDNLQAVMELGGAQRRPEIVLRAAIALDVIASGTGLSRAELSLLDDALTGSGNGAGAVDPWLLGRALGVRAGALRALGRLEEAERDAVTALSLARRAGSARQIVAMHLAVGSARFQLGDLEPALAHARAALVTATAAADHRSEPLALQQIGGVLQAMGDASAARAHYEGALSLAVERGDPVAECRASMGLGSYHLEAGDLDRAEAFYERALLVARRLEMTRNVRIVMGYIGVVHLDAGRAQEAEGWLDSAARASRAVGDVRVEGVFAGIRGAALATLDLLDEARRAFALAHRLLAENPYFRAVIELHQGHLDLALGRAAELEGDDEGSRAHVYAAEQRLFIAEVGVDGEAPLTRRSDDARIAVRVLRRALSAT